MKIGLVSAILEGYSFEEMIDICSKAQFKCVEILKLKDFLLDDNSLNR